MKDLVGRKINGFRIDSLLGEGGMGAVFKAYDLQLQRDVAIKVMHPHIARQPAFQQRFLSEARTAARLKHPSIVQVHEIEAKDELLFIVMEFISGDDLQKMLAGLRANGQWIVLDEAVQIVRHVSLAMDYAHRHGVLHRDIKPSNIMLEPEPTEGLPYRPVITDLGLAKFVEADHRSHPGVVMGTPTYMSPEQAQGLPTDQRSDVYSLGILLYELSVGRPPFLVSSLTEAIRCHSTEPPPLPSRFHSGIPNDMEIIILKCLNKDPGMRFRNAAALANSLQIIRSQTSRIQAPPTQLQSSVSLVTQYQKSLLTQRGSSIMDGFQPPPSQLGQDRVQIRLPDKSTQFFDIKPGVLTIGRDPTNDITIDEPLISRRHARIDFDGQTFMVTDLGSSNGTYLNNVKMIPNQPENWSYNVNLRMGNTWMRLEQASAGAVAPGFPTKKQTQMTTSIGDIELTLDNTQLSVDPGASTRAEIRIENLGTEVEHYRLNIEGIPQDWVKILPDRHQLLPGDIKVAQIEISPPRTPQSRSADYPINVCATDEQKVSKQARIQAILTVAAFIQSSTSLHPERVRSGKPASITIQNQGNSPVDYQLNWQDRENELLFEPPSAQINVPEGSMAEVQFRAMPSKKRWIGGEKLHNISIEVSGAGQQVGKHSGEIVSRAMIPVWVPPLLLVLCMVCIASGYYLWNIFDERNQHATETAIAATRIAEENIRATQTFEALSSQEKTATADWMEMDNDGDGLKNGEESNVHNTNPNIRDSDGDDVDDGDEVNIHKTDPNKKDSDGDNVNDGEELRIGTNPLSTDSDNDGVPDNLDDAPISTPTGTPTQTNTPSPTDTMTPTSTNTSTPSSTPTETLTPTPTLIGGGSGILAYESYHDSQVDIFLIGDVLSGSESPTRWFTVSGYSTCVSWSPDGQRLAYSGQVDGTEDIFTINADGTGGRNLTNNSSSQDECPSWSSDGSQIAFMSNRDGNWEIYVMNEDGSNQRNITNNSAHDFLPDWSPDDQAIAFISNRDGNYEIYRMNIEGFGLVNLSNDPATDILPDWSPDGRYITFVSSRDGNAEIYIMNSDGSAQRNISNHSGEDYYPAWSPDGRLIAFVSDRYGTRELFIMTITGRNPVTNSFDPYRVTNNSSDESYPDWQP